MPWSSLLVALAATIASPDVGPSMPMPDRPGFMRMCIAATLHSTPDPAVVWVYRGVCSCTYEGFGTSDALAKPLITQSMNNCLERLEADPEGFLRHYGPSPDSLDTEIDEFLPRWEDIGK